MGQPIKRFVEILGGSLGVAGFFIVITAMLVIIDAKMRGDDMQMAIDFSYPHNPGYKGQLTSKEAAENKKSTKAQDTLNVIAALDVAGPDGLTADEVALIYGFDRQYTKFRPRFSELAKLGLIEPTGEKRDSYVGQPMMVYRLVRNGQ